MENTSSFTNEMAPKFSTLLDVVKTWHLREDLESGVRNGVEETIQSMPWIVRIFVQKGMRRRLGYAVTELSDRVDELELRVCHVIESFIDAEEKREFLETGDFRFRGPGFGISRKFRYEKLIETTVAAWVQPIVEKYVS